jgi:hypothetical protein
MPQRRAAQRFADARELREGETWTAKFFGQMWRPEAQLLDRLPFRLQPRQQFAKRVVEKIRFEGQRLLTNEPLNFIEGRP